MSGFGSPTDRVLPQPPLSRADGFNVDACGRRLRPGHVVPDPESSKRFDIWREGVLDPGTVLTYWSHERDGRCTSGWVRSGAWWFVCGDCHPDAIDEATAQSRSSRTPDGPAR